MKLRTLLVPASCLLAFGCAAEGDVDPGTARAVPDAPFELTLEGVGVFHGRAEYEVSEPTDDYMPVPRLVLHGLESQSSDAVVLRLGQQNPGDIAADYDFPGAENAFIVEMHGKTFEGTVGEVQLDVTGKLLGSFALESTDLDGADKIMLEGHFRAERLFLNCNRLTKGNSGSSPGQAGDGSDVYWEPDTQVESAFCGQMREALGALYGG